MGKRERAAEQREGQICGPLGPVLHGEVDHYPGRKESKQDERDAHSVTSVSGWVLPIPGLRQAGRAYSLGLMERQQLLDREAASWDSFMIAVARVPEPRRTELGVVPEWSVADLVWHCGYWVNRAARRIELIAAGRPEPEDPEGVWQARYDG